MALPSRHSAPPTRSMTQRAVLLRSHPNYVKRWMVCLFPPNLDSKALLISALRQAIVPLIAIIPCERWLCGYGFLVRYTIRSEDCCIGVGDETGKINGPAISILSSDSRRFKGRRFWPHDLLGVSDRKSTRLNSSH